MQNGTFKRVFSLDPEHKFVLTKKDLKNGIKLCLKILKKEKERGLLQVCTYILLFFEKAIIKFYL